MNEEIISMATVAVVAIFAQLYLGNRENQTYTQFVIEILFWLVISYFFFSNMIKYLFDIEISTRIRNVLTNNPVIEVNVDKNGKEKGKKGDKKKKTVTFKQEPEVFHVSGNQYRYKDAAPICKAYGAKLATYEQMEKAYEGGAEWCEYGWSEDQMAFFPTQKETYEKLQGTSNKHACGRPGVNGGYLENPNIRFGVNCYGVKPDMNENEKYLMENTSYFNDPEEKKEQKRANYWESRIDELIISPFNENKWNRI